MSCDANAEQTQPAASAQAEYERLVERDLRRNVTGVVGWDFLWGLGMPFAMFPVFTPAYLGEMNAPKAVIGLVLASPSLFAALQLLPGYFIQPRRRLRRYRTMVILGLLPYFLYGVTSTLWGAAWPAPVHIALFSAGMLSLLLVSNIGGGIYWEMLTDNIPVRRRGWLFGLRMAGQGTAGVLTGAVALWVLNHWQKPLNFRISFLIGSSLYLISCASLWLIRDHVNPAHSHPRRAVEGPITGYVLDTFRKAWSDANYRTFLFFHALLVIAATNAPFMVDAAREQLGASAAGQGIFSFIYLGVAACFGWVIGRLADRYGYRLIGCVCGSLLTVTFLLCLTAPRMLYWYAAYGCYALTWSSLGMLLCNMGAEIHPAIAPNRLVGVGNLLLVGFVVIAGLLSGAVAGWAGSYRPVFIANLVVSVLAVLGFLFIVREPRVERPRDVKMSPRA